MSSFRVLINVVLVAGIAGFICSSPMDSPQPSRNSNTTESSSTSLPLLRVLVRKPRLPVLSTRPNFFINRNYLPSFNKSSLMSTTTTTTTTESTLKQADILEISSTDDKLAVAWPVPRRPASKRFRPPSVITTTLSPLAKLRRPRPSRPAMYSLDGFVPKPSLQFKPTTEAPADVLAWKQDLQALGSITRRRKVNFGNEAAEDDSIRRYKPTAKKNSTRKQSPNRVRPNRRKGIAGVDFPSFDFIPFTSFDCSEKDNIAGMYADPETKCQVWHLCPGGMNQYRHSFLCPNGTVFNERRGICDWWYNVDC